jgi:hypothetical protein
MAQILKHLGILIDGINFTDVIPISVAHIYHAFDRSFTAAKLIMIKKYNLFLHLDSNFHSMKIYKSLDREIMFN